MRIATREHAAALGLADVWDREQGQARHVHRNVEVVKSARRPRAVNDQGMNKTEARYDVHLSDLKAQGRIADHGFEAFKWRLAGRTWITVDFAVWLPDGRLIAVDVKGWLEDDAAVKVKVLAEQRPRLPVYLVSYQRGAWVYRHCGRGGIRACESPFV